MRERTSSVRWILGILCLVLFSQVSFAQNTIRATGKIVDPKDNTALAGATVSRVGGREVAVANNQGVFEITVPAGSTLRVTVTGYETFTIKAGADLNIPMTPVTSSLEDVVVVGYGTQKKELLSGSVVSMKMDEPRRLTPTTSLGNLLAGQLTGVRVSTPNGIPGTQPGIAIRTGTSFNAQNVLYVIDGKIIDIYSDITYYICAQIERI